VVVRKPDIISKEAENARIIVLVNRAQEGDDKAFTELVKIFQPKIMYIIKRFIHEAVDISDVSQEVFFKVHKYIRSFKGESSFYTWLYSVTTSVAKNYLMQMKRNPLSTTLDNSFTDFMDFAVDIHTNENPQDILVSDETESIIVETLESLPEILRDVIVLREIEGLSYLKISELLNIPEGTVRSRLHRARNIIEESIGDKKTVLRPE
jgi:RNA polymerase sigma-70 factor (ECF subfamily)